MIVSFYLSLTCHRAKRDHDFIKNHFQPAGLFSVLGYLQPSSRIRFLSGWRGLWVTQKKGYATTFERYEFITMQFINNHNILQVISP